MRTRTLMTVTALLMALPGVGLTFFSAEILQADGWTGGPGQQLLGQMIGALYLGFAMLNWSARGNLLGGIYSRPIVLGNFVYFAVAAPAMVRALSSHAPIAVLLALHAGLGVWFGVVLFSRTPVPGAPR